MHQIASDVHGGNGALTMTCMYEQYYSKSFVLTQCFPFPSDAAPREQIFFKYHQIAATEVNFTQQISLYFKLKHFHTEILNTTLTD